MWFPVVSRDTIRCHRPSNKLSMAEIFHGSASFLFYFLFFIFFAIVHTNRLNRFGNSFIIGGKNEKKNIHKLIINGKLI